MRPWRSDRSGRAGPATQKRNGVATFSPGGALPRAALELTIRANSLHLVEDNRYGESLSVQAALREDVLETARYPEISFTSRHVTFEPRGDGTYDVRLLGEISLHGVRRVVSIPARIALKPGVLRAIGSFEIRQSDFKITPYLFVNGALIINDTVTLSFDIIAPQS